eukprot:TRINITY_DN39025_c0_g1_i1.p1 TRINITY_DN39025_c0_g1~~TRINITY_DN39025_c0_g1_i1.p1  ORF type:complete len:242 (+),score=28.32 TRINITY_DN39025_c0_g1_i1:73-798(+)
MKAFPAGCQYQNCSKARLPDPGLCETESERSSEAFHDSEEEDTNAYSVPRKPLGLNKKFPPHRRIGVRTILVRKLIGGDCLELVMPSRTIVSKIREELAARHKCLSHRVQLFTDTSKLQDYQLAPSEINLVLNAGGEWHCRVESETYDLSVSGTYFALTSDRSDCNMNGCVLSMTEEELELQIVKDHAYSTGMTLAGQTLIFSRVSCGGLRGRLPAGWTLRSGVPCFAWTEVQLLEEKVIS